jgi:amidase
MGTTIDAVKLLMTSILSTQPWIRDPAVVSMPWNSDVEKATLARASANGAANEKQPLKLGVFWSDGVVGPQPPIKRGLRLVHDVLKSTGHRVRYG